jgi:hypothetical protein
LYIVHRSFDEEKKENVHQKIVDRVLAVMVPSIDSGRVLERKFPIRDAKKYLLQILEDLLGFLWKHWF